MSGDNNSHMFFDQKEKFCFCRKCCIRLDVWAGAPACWSTTVTDDMSKVLLIQGSNLSGNLACSQSIPGREPDQRHHCAIGCNKDERQEGCWMFSFWQSAGTLVLFTQRQVAVVPFLSHGIDRPGFLIWEDDRPSSRSRL